MGTVVGTAPLAVGTPHATLGRHSHRPTCEVQSELHATQVPYTDATCGAGYTVVILRSRAAARKVLS